MTVSSTRAGLRYSLTGLERGWMLQRISSVLFLQENSLIFGLEKSSGFEKKDNRTINQ
jgi:hypothetical protein